ncbi:hypothetical protein Slin_6807 (plasmid) [Spirosoma linguale DSM 74]|uniref:Uncharacterized protein n=1 Tax=Spirosoma linguale (strain ATCC 33905 / DSM 74 / LMG 10896 / Claus 1) TaxID=504472 RepID=D2QVC5_SPILD|nr:hypothetical protein Slin_6807 [Spirosoma linguale DSM 74]
MDDFRNFNIYINDSLLVKYNKNSIVKQFFY